MKTVTILSDFSSYPNGKDERVWKTGEEAELSNEHADLLVGKGLAKEAKAAKPAPAPTTQDPEKTAPSPASGTVASVPFVITKAQRAQLRTLGKSDAEISRMTPAEAHDVLSATTKAALAPAAEPEKKDDNA
ncbi:hypothetical protein ASF53_13995 [Methylobacterium sp. Leaf123]|uniref:hypothetical protein n=1 Tax=Methylobacterium sp. Leaf123 TaxID=1736264 RepID=UPI0006F443D3|nr:hypothetical protein [Methylobacterium sp. Leaf123]KQQ13282.1 hypothetical protein ASF53_13995 [Methylobacterium sp. Leaf123]